ncbi:MAG: hypothetical protein ABSE63_18670, partial [Thermoguttaceae bacterium]
RPGQIAAYLNFLASPVTPFFHICKNKGEDWGVWAKILMLELMISILTWIEKFFTRRSARKQEMITPARGG